MLGRDKGIPLIKLFTSRRVFVETLLAGRIYTTVQRTLGQLYWIRKKINQELGWCAKTGLRLGVEHTWRWLHQQ